MKKISLPIELRKCPKCGKEIIKRGCSCGYKGKDKPQNNYLRVGEAIECSNCQPAKDYISCDLIFKEHGIRCNCICHKPEQEKEYKNTQNAWFDNFDKEVALLKKELMPTTNKTWEEEFRNRWKRKFGILFISKEIGKKNKGKVYASPEDIKDFIEETLLQQKEEMVKKIEGMNDKANAVYRQALQDILI